MLTALYWIGLISFLVPVKAGLTLAFSNVKQGKILEAFVQFIVMIGMIMAMAGSILYILGGYSIGI